MKSHVYVLLHKTGQHLKIGKADDVIARASILGPHLFDIRQSFALSFSTVSDANRAERAMHKLFHPWRRHPSELEGVVPADGRTEWFSAECIGRVRSFAAQNGDLLACRMVTGVELQAALEVAAVESVTEPKQKVSGVPSPHFQLTPVAPPSIVPSPAGSFIRAQPSTKSARERLLEMPEVFSLGELALVMGVDRSAASNYLLRWRGSGQVVGLGGKSGIFLNQVRVPDARSNGALWERALLKAMPSAIIGGHEVLADSGLTTQVTHQRYVLVSNTDSFYEVDGAEVHRRPVPWLNRLVRTGAVINSDPGVLAPRLRPGAALADLALYAERKPDPDDIDMDAVEPEEVKLFRSLTKAEAVEDVTPKRRMRPS